jgi:sugar fermentation stimulation protein A
MLNCQTPGSRVWFSTSDNPQRKYPNTWELVESEFEEMIGINTARANSLVFEALEQGVIPELLGYQSIRREVPYGDERSRVDFLLSASQDGSEADCYLEVKNVSLGLKDGLGMFPDAVTTRGQKHLRELIEIKAKKNRAVLLFCVQHTGIRCLEPADSIDPVYGQLLREAKSKGVELLAYSAELSPEQITMKKPVKINLP